MEDLQVRNKVKLLNSKLDFVQPMRTQLAVLNKNLNKAPGNPDTQTITSAPLNNLISLPGPPRHKRRPLVGHRRRQTQPNSQSFIPRKASTPTKPSRLPDIINMSPIKMNEVDQDLKNSWISDEEIITNCDDGDNINYTLTEVQAHKKKKKAKTVKFQLSGEEFCSLEDSTWGMSSPYQQSYCQAQTQPQPNTRL